MTIMNIHDVPETFLADVKDVLENLYDFTFLNRHLLAATSPIGQPREAAGHRLRRELVEAIETLNPKSGGAGGRVYDLLNLHYVAGMTVPEAASNLGVSARQAYRDLRQGHETVGYLLWYRRQNAINPADVMAEPALSEPVPDEFTPTNIIAMIETAIKAVSRLAEQSGIRLQVSLPDAPIVIATDQAAAQQVVIHLLSQTIQAAEAHPLWIQLTATGDVIALELRYRPRDPSARVPISTVIAAFIERLHFQVIESFGSSDENACLTLMLTARRATLLVIDDHVGLSDLLQRYLTGRSLEVLAAADALTGLKLAQDIQPNALLVDLMMPGMDGWELLQRLRTTPGIAHLPVIICSVINDPELAYSLGASYFLPKPITRDSLLAALEKIGL